MKPNATGGCDAMPADKGKAKMTTLKKNFRSKKVPNQCTRHFDITKLIPKPRKNFRTTETSKGAASVKSPIAKSYIDPRVRGYVRVPADWRPIDGGYMPDDRGSPYLLLSEDEDDFSQVNENAKKLRAPTCHNVLHEPRLKLEPPDVKRLVRGIRLSICVEHTHFPLIAKVSKGLGLTHVPEHRLWNVQWCDNTPHFDLLKSMKRFQQINHFPGMMEICRKDLLSRNLNRMLKMYPGDYRIFPKTWLLPTDTYDVAVYASKHKRTFILKPYSSGQGRGIWLTNNLRTVGRQEKLICQTYIEKPLLIDGFKFDLRVYTLVTSVDPLRIFVYNEGLARFATHKYKPPALGNSNNMFMHLTNYCVNRRSCNYDAGTGNDKGSKRKLSAYNKWLADHNYDVDEFWATVDDAIIKTVISAWPVLKHNYHVCFPKHDKIQACFQLLGFDILVDWKLKPYILEVNHTPSLAGGEPVDFEVKRPLIRDTLNLISMPLVDKEEIIREDRALLRDRLMRQMHRRRVVTPPKDGSGQRPAGGADDNPACSLGALAQQIAWEESHLGNYRRIMPPTDSNRISYYFKFYNQYKDIPMFKDNIASNSRHREHLRQEQLQNQLQDEHSQLNEQLQTPLLSKQMLKQKRMQTLAIIKDIHVQKAKMLKQPEGKERVGLWQMRNTPVRTEVTRRQDPENSRKSSGQPSRHSSTPSSKRSPRPSSRHSSRQFRKPTDSDESTDAGEHKALPEISPSRIKRIHVPNAKASRRAKHRKLQQRIKRSRRLERESRLDAEFLAKHSIVANSRLIAGSSRPQISATTQMCSRAVQMPCQLTELESRLNAFNQVELKSYQELTFSKYSDQNIDWLPEPIDEADNQQHFEWRTEREMAVKNSMFKEVIRTTIS
ncbi:hypothetical protein AWZ03_003005 [Drosophila navojoa]|uniref:Tubulin--tyrosine ligase-like protein 9 n=1 Tax=Drosophila navojoa TaxID=7232 RepID=A0A484BSF7_DRONA|nr:hypothetical protein AWZ03_003005 [Drosophila navojoa]